MDISLSCENKKSKFIQIVKHLNKFSEFINIVFDVSGLSIEGMDQSRISIYMLKLANDWFDVYKVETGSRIGINSNTFAKILQICKDDDELLLSLCEENQDSLKITFNSKNSFIKQFDIPLVDVDSEKICVKDIDCDVEFSIKTKTFAQTVDELKIFDDVITIQSSESSICFRSKGIEGSMMCVLYDEEQSDTEKINDFSCVEGVNFNKSYSSKILSIFSCFDKVSPDVKILLTDDMPLQMIYAINEESSLKLYLAPKMQDYDDEEDDN